jgi:NADH-quinone oxidoreductase subunit E
VKGSASVLEALERELGIAAGETSRDGLFSLEVVACVGACGLAPVISIDGEFHGGLTPDAVGGILQTYRDKAKTDDPTQ